MRPRPRASLSGHVEAATKAAGLPPGTPIYTGRQSDGPARLTATDWGPDVHHRQVLREAVEAAPFRDSPAPTWIALIGLHDVEAVAALGAVFELHPLVIEDICNVQQRPKLEDLGHVLFISMKLARFDEQAGRIEQDTLSMVLGERYLLSFEETDLELFEPVDAALEQGGTRLRDSGPDYLLYRLMDLVVDQYIVTLEQIGDAVEAIEDALIACPEQLTVGRIHDLRRDLMEMRRSIWPLRDVTRRLQRDCDNLVKRDTHLYFSDLSDHLNQALDILETELTLAGGLYDVYQNAVSNLSNQRIHVLTVFSTIFMPLTFIVGIYGMNFEHMPELRHPYGYPITISVMVLITALMLVWFRVKRWI